MARQEKLQRSPTELRWKLPRRVPPIRAWAFRRLERQLFDEDKRQRINEAYLRLTLRQKKAFRALYAKMFRDSSLVTGNSFWDVMFAGRRIRLPLQEDSLWLDWDSALSLMGHDIKVKLTYESLLYSSRPPRSFLDVGANYGTHSLLHLVHGLDVYSIEPNPHCRGPFERWCGANGVVGRMENLAFGTEDTTLELSFPERETWLGTLNAGAQVGMEAESGLKLITTRVMRLDDFLAQRGFSPDLIKIDTEGYELQVLAGAEKTLCDLRPTIIFECLERDSREQIGTLLRSSDYTVCALPLLSGSPLKSLTKDAFVESVDNNYMALPSEHAILKERL